MAGTPVQCDNNEEDTYTYVRQAGHSEDDKLEMKQCDNCEEDTYTCVRTQAGHSEYDQLEMKQNEAYASLNSPSTHEFDDYDYI